MEVEFSVSMKTTKKKKSFVRRGRHCFKGLYDSEGMIPEGMNSGRMNSRYVIDNWINRREFSNRQREFLSSGCLTILLTLHKAQYEKETQTDSDASICSCCKENINGDKISFHKDCLGKASKCPKCKKDVSLPNWFDHVCQMENAPGESSTAQTSGSRHKDKTLQDLKKLFLNQENFDVVLRMQGQEFSAHQAILTACSPVFASTFRSNMREETGTVEIDDIDPSCFPEFLCFLYCGEVDKLSTENVRSLFSAADKYQIMDLRMMCLQFMKDNVTVETFCDTLVLALLHTETDLIEACTDYFVRNAEEILVSVKWQIFAAEYPTQSTELFIKHVKHVKQFIK